MITLNNSKNNRGMDKRDILIVAIVAIVASLAVSTFAPQIGLGPPGGFGSGTVKNAHACNADENCYSEASSVGEFAYPNLMVIPLFNSSE